LNIILFDVFTLTYVVKELRGAKKPLTSGSK